MLGLMQDWPLLCHRIIDHAAIQHAERPVVTRSVEGPIHTTNYREIRKRALKLAKRLDKDGIRLGDRVATLAWNTWRHLECWYGILGIGAVYHTVNPRLSIEGILRTMFDPRNNLANEVSAQLSAHFGDKVYRTVIPRNVRLAEAPSHGRTIFEYDNSGAAATNMFFYFAQTFLGPQPPTERDHPQRSSTAEGAAPTNEPSRPWRAAQKA